MPDIFPPNKKKDNDDKTNSSRTQTDPKKQIKPNTSSTPSYKKPSFNSPWGSGDSSGNSSFGQNRMSTEEKIEMVKKIYKEVLDREPTTKDINYYKYSSLDEKGIIKQLVKSKEHQELVSNGKKYKKLENEANQNSLKVKQLKAQIKDQVEEMQKLAQLLREKNRYIEQLRKQSNNPYNIVKRPPQEQK